MPSDGKSAASNGGSRTSFVHVCKWSRSLRVLRSKLRQLETGRTHEVVHLPVQMTTAPNMAPHGGEAALPTLDARLGREPVFDENELSIRLEDAAHLT